jgi:DNA repair protein RadC
MKQKNGFTHGAFTAPEIEIVYHPNVKLSKRPALSGLDGAARYFFKTWDQGTISTKQNIRIILLSHKYILLGLYELSIGIKSDNLYKYIFLPALRANACAVCIGINHISNNLEPTKFELHVLKRIIEAGKLFKVDVWDFDIITKHDFYSFRKVGRLNDNLIHDKIRSDLSLNQNIQNAVKVDFLKGFVKEIKLENNSSTVHDSVSTINLPRQQKPSTNKEYKPLFVPKPIGKENVIVNNPKVINRFQKLVSSFKTHPEILKGPIRNLTIHAFWRESKRNWWPDGNRGMGKDCCHIILMGHWISKAGFSIHEKIQVIPLSRMLIIIPETK